MNKRILVCIFCSVLITFCFWSNTFSQGKWTLEKCIAYAKENNLQLKQANYDVEIARTNLNSSYNSYLPDVNANARHTNYNGRSVNPYTYIFTTNNYNSENFSVNGNVVLFKGNQRNYDIKQNEFTLQAVLMDIEKLKNDMSMTIASMYLDLLYFDEMIKTDSAQLNETNSQITKALQLVKAGIKTETYLYDLQTQFAQDNYNLIKDKVSYHSKIVDLIQLLELASPDSFEIEKPVNLDMVLLLKPDTFDNYYNNALETLPQIKSAQYKLNSSENYVKYTKGNRYPVLSFETAITSGYSSNSKLFDVSGNATNYPYSKQIRDNMNMYYGLQMNIPIFRHFQNRNSIRIAKYNFSKAELNVELVKKQVYKDVQKAYYDALSANEKLQSMKALQNATELSFKHTEGKLSSGIITIYDYSTMKMNLAKATSSYLQAKYEYIFKLKILDFYKGNIIGFQN